MMTSWCALEGNPNARLGQRPCLLGKAQQIPVGKAHQVNRKGKRNLVPTRLMPGNSKTRKDGGRGQGRGNEKGAEDSLGTR